MSDFNDYDEAYELLRKTPSRLERFRAVTQKIQVPYGVKAYFNRLKYRLGLSYRWRTLRGATRAFVMRWSPLVPKSWIHGETLRMSRIVENAHSQFDEERKKMSEFLKGLARVTASRSDYESSGQPRYRVMVEIDPMMVRQMFEWGNDQKLIGYVCQHLSRQVEQELRTINFARVQPERRRYARIKDDLYVEE